MAHSISLLLQRMRRLSTTRYLLTWRACITPLAGAAVLVGGPPALAAPGQLDSTFATICPVSVCTGGRLFSAVGSGGAAEVAAVAVQPDSKILVAGTCKHKLTTGVHDGLAHDRFCVERYRQPLFTGGSWLDTPIFGLGGFGNNLSGTAIIAMRQNENAKLNSARLLPDGKILLAGTCDFSVLSTYQFCVTRLLANGAQDANFASGLVGPNASSLTTMLVQPDGRIVLVGECVITGLSHFCLARLLPDGQVDRDFGSNGIVMSTTAFNRVPSGAVLRADGSIVVAGTCNDFGTKFCLRSYTATGATDTSFGPPNLPLGPPNTTRTLHIDVGTTTDTASGGVTQTASGLLIVSGSCINTPTAANVFLFCTVRVTANGALDSSFGTNGYQFDRMGIGHSYPTATAIQPDGKIVVAGVCDNGNEDYCAIRYHSEGVIDNSFSLFPVTLGLTGHLTQKPPARANAMALQTDGNVVIAGKCSDAATDKFCTVRLQGGPYGYKQCTMDIDGDGQVLGTTDAIIHARVAAGLSGSAVLNGLTFAPSAQRTTWPAIRDFLGYHCGMLVKP